MKKILLFLLCLFILWGGVSAQEFEKVPYGDVTVIIEPSNSPDLALHLLYLIDLTDNGEVYIYHLDTTVQSHTFEVGELWVGHQYQIYAVAVNTSHIFSDASNSLYFEVTVPEIPAEKKPAKKDKPIPPGLAK
jgi:hypothetical protein